MKSISHALAAVALATVTLLHPGMSRADDPEPATQSIGAQATVNEGLGVHGLTVNDLRPSSDVIPYQSRGTLWEVTVIDEAMQGTVFPIVANFSARSPGGQNYQALFSVPTAQGLAPAGISQGQKTSGKVYFDVIGDAPNSVVYQTGGTDMIRWVAAPPQAVQTPSRPQAPAAVPRAPAAASPAPPRNSAPRPARPGPTTPPPSGSAGTPLPG